MNMIISRDEATRACVSVDKMQEMGLISGAEAVIAQTEIIARTVPVEAVS